jgi:hypothetical protein
MAGGAIVIAAVGMSASGIERDAGQVRAQGHDRGDERGRDRRKQVRTVERFLIERAFGGGSDQAKLPARTNPLGTHEVRTTDVQRVEASTRRRCPSGAARASHRLPQKQYLRLRSAVDAVERSRSLSVDLLERKT